MKTKSCQICDGNISQSPQCRKYGFTVVVFFKGCARFWSVKTSNAQRSTRGRLQLIVCAKLSWSFHLQRNFLMVADNTLVAVICICCLLLGLPMILMRLFAAQDTQIAVPITCLIRVVMCVRKVWGKENYHHVLEFCKNVGNFTITLVREFFI